MAHALKMRDRIVDALHAAKDNVPELEPYGAGWRQVSYDELRKTWDCTEELPYQEARRAHAKALAARALEIMGAQPQDARMAIDASQACRGAFEMARNGRRMLGIQ